MLKEIRAEQDKIKALIDAASELPPDTSSSTISMVHEYLCVAICGRLEQDIKAILVEHARRQSKTKLERAISRLCRQLLNPETRKILDMIELFDKDFKKQLSKEWEESGSDGEVINEMVGHRKRIAHQTNSSRSMTKSKISMYFKAYKNVIAKIDGHFL